MSPPHRGAAQLRVTEWVCPRPGTGLGCPAPPSWGGPSPALTLGRASGPGRGPWPSTSSRPGPSMGDAGITDPDSSGRGPAWGGGCSATQILRVCEAQTRGGKWPPACGAASVRGVGDGLHGADTGRVPAAGGACVDAAEAPASRAEATRQGDSWERELRSPALPGSACAWASRQGPQARGRPPLVLLEASPWPKARWPRRTPPPAGLRGGPWAGRPSIQTGPGLP